MKPLIKGFKATNIKTAFLLNSIATGLITSIPVIIKNLIDKYKNDHSDVIDIGNLFFIFISTFLITLLVFYLLYIFFGYGGGMLA